LDYRKLLDARKRLDRIRWIEVFGKLRAATARQFTIKRRVDQFPGGPNVIGHAQLHRRGNPKRLMHAAEILIGRVQGERRDVMLKLFREGICEPRKPALLHTDHEVLSLDIGR
jgi:hypothetical protein